MRSGRIAPRVDQFQRRDAVSRCCRVVALVLEDQSRSSRTSGSSSTTRIAPVRRPSAMLVRPFLAIGCSRAVVPSALGGEHDLDGEDRALARLRADAHPVAQQIAQALHDGKTEAEAAAPLARGIVELMVFARRSPEVPRSGMPMPVSQTSMLSSLRRATATEQHLAAPGIFQCVREQVADHLLEQTRIAVDREAASGRRADEALAPGVIGELVPSTGQADR